MVNLMVWCALCVAAQCAGAGGGAAFVGVGFYDVQTTVELSAATKPGPRPVSYRLQGTLDVQLAWTDPEDDQHALIQFTLQSVSLWLQGAHVLSEYTERGSPWKARAPDAFYARWRRGRLLAAYLDPQHPPAVRDYQRALLSLFQFQLQDGEHNETDISGECSVLYESISPTVLRKIKRGCGFESGAEGGFVARRVARYTLSATRDALDALHAEEVVSAGLGDTGVKARSWHTLARTGAGAKPSALAPHAALDAALAALPPHLQDVPLPMPLDPIHDVENESLEAVVERCREALEGEEAGGGGTLGAARALPALLKAVRRATPAQLSALLAAPDEHVRLEGLSRVLGLAGTRGAWRALRSVAAPHTRDALEPLVHAYLGGLALCDAPEDEVVTEVLKLGEDAKLASVAESALLAGAAAAGRGAGAVAARDGLARGLARCGGDAAAAAACRAGRLRALGNVRGAGGSGTLLAAAERHAGAAGLAALEALEALGGAEGGVKRLYALATNASRSLEERALALDLALLQHTSPRLGDAVPLGVVSVARALVRERSADAHELRRALWQRLEALEARPAVRALWRHLPRDLRSWDAQAHAGSTQVLERGAGAAWGEWRGALRSTQLAARGMLRRGVVQLTATTDAGREEDLLAVGAWTRGLDSMTGAGEAEGGEAEAPAAGLQLSVRGVALRPLTLFEGQAELLGHIWAGTGAAPTSVLRALVPLAGWGGAAPLQAGVALGAWAESTGALALDARGDVSLWYRTARARLALRAAAAARVHASLRTPWSTLRAEVRAEAAPRLRIATDTDFYDAVTLCVRSDLSPHLLERSVELRAVGGARDLHVRRTRTERTAHAGRTLALGRRNDAACRVLRANDAPDDDLP